MLNLAMFRKTIPTWIFCSLNLAITISVIMISASLASANFASDERREPSPSFTQFFLKKFDAWFSRFDKLDFKFAPSELAFDRLFLKTATVFGEKTPDGFLRALNYQTSYVNKQVVHGPRRYLDVEKRPGIKMALEDVIRVRAPKFQIENLRLVEKIGLGLRPPNADLEILIWEPELASSSWLKGEAKILSSLATDRKAGLLILSLKDSRIVDIEVQQLGFNSKDTCAAALKIAQVDRLISRNGHMRSSWHLDQFEDQALSPGARELAEQVRAGLNLIPGTIDCESAQSTRFSYP